MNDSRSESVLAAGIPLTWMEKAYAAISPAAFNCAHLFERFRGASDKEQQSRLGYVARRDRPTIWFHGASAGEMAAANALVKMIRSRGFQFEVVYTATNRAGVDYVERVDRYAAAAGLMPWDTSECVARALDRWNPKAIFLVETELWPRFVFEASSRQIPVFSVSARIYPADLKRYRMIRSFIAPTLQRITQIFAQDEVERDRFVQIGAPEERCFSAGNLKYLGSDSTMFRDHELAAELGIEQNDQIVVFGSVHRDEIAKLFETIERIVSSGHRVIVAPRHLSSVDLIRHEAMRRDLNFSLRSNVIGARRWRLLVLDSMGELSRIYSLATCAVVGGGFESHGGHNPFEPVIAGTPVAFGHHFFHFDSEARALRSVSPTAQVSAVEELDQLLTGWLADDDLRRRVFESQCSVLPDGGAIADRYMDVLQPWLSDCDG
jgi:3-deoxy-D-manno-octulosonic-acid transferase